MKHAIIIVDHGSSREQSNQLLVQIAQAFAAKFASKYPIVEAAHMEMAEPSIRQAYAKCVERGATRITVCPFFLGPGKHMTVDIPQLVKDAAEEFPQTTVALTGVLAPDDLLLQLIDRRISETV
jgi:sirohydrochlorin ferrochelatase